ncbi:type ISP restriction/modification enzyme [Thermomonospora umbrina]|uniref:site-specific DNA-methyltransferase (adenine-specific) n=1 Tax=Thermomonospora umbrina TaxID=111806 RepID=A0A3D9SPQ2_9ACTN|nr:type ISP restriction/modification enzyme [Thermomonospora umbrina]REE97888.1 N-6 DNA methylase [Thermomonospora umbrina]
MASTVPDWLTEKVADFGEACRERLSGGVGEAEAAIRGPLESLLRAVGSSHGLDVVPHGEAPLSGLGVRPDYAVRVDGAVTGYIEIKRPGAVLNPEVFKSHNLRQWQRLRDLPNLIYTNGTHWRLYKDGELVREAVLNGDLRTAGRTLSVPDSSFEQVLMAFLAWAPQPITSVGALVKAVAALCRLLRASVLDQLAAERRAIREGADKWQQPFMGLARDWRNLLFPTADDTTFADYYAQTLTFALLLARSENIDVAGADMHRIAKRLGAGQEHALMSKALQLLTDSATDQLTVTLDLLRRVIGAVDWPRVRAGHHDAYLHLYESFLDIYDPGLRQASGSYYTPREVVDAMVRLVGDVLATRLNTPGRYLAPSVTTVDPAMGTGTYLHAVIEHSARQAGASDGAGVIPKAITALVRRLIGFEMQMGPYAVAEMRTADLLKRHGAHSPAGGLRLYVTNTLDDPYIEMTQIAATFEPIARSRRRANEVKANTPVTVVIGNPPYREHAEGEGGWVESGNPNTAVPLDRFRLADNGRMEHVLKNLYVYFWAWATWKVFDAHHDDRHGVVAFITTSGYLKGPGFKGMRRYLRRTCSEGWIIDVTPEGMRPDIPTRVFRGVQQPLAIGIFVRRSDTDPDTPATLHHIKVTGLREDKYRQLADLTLDNPRWRRVRNDWQAPFTPAADSAWDDYPALGDLFAWTAPGVKPNRTWVYAPSPEILQRRWAKLVGETNIARKRALLKETRDRDLNSNVQSLPRGNEHSTTLAKETGPCPEPRRIAYRSFDRHWVIPDRRIIDFPRPELWEADQAGQVFISEQHSQPIAPGPAVTFAALVPDMHHFKGSEGGRVLPMLHPNGSPNLAPGLTAELTRRLGVPVTVQDTTAYIAAVTSHTAFTVRFLDELSTPGVRVPITGDPRLFAEAVALGESLIWAATYGAAAAAPDQGRPAGTTAFPPGDERRVGNLTPIGDRLPEKIVYEEAARRLHVGAGIFGPVTPRMWEYGVSGMNVIRHWFGYRKANPSGKKTSPLDDTYLDQWPHEWVTELNELLTALRRITDLEPAQAALLDRILNGPIITGAALASAGVRFPTVSKDRKPRYGLSASEFDSRGRRVLM